MEQATPLRGWRAYELRLAGDDDVILVGLAYGYWEGVQLQAQCRHAGFVSSGPYGLAITALPSLRDPADAARDHLRDSKCGCGIHGVWRLTELEQWERSMTNRCGIRAAAVGWGVAVVGQRGWRAEWARIERLWFRPRCVVCGEDAASGLFAARGSGPLLLCTAHEAREYQSQRLFLSSRLDVAQIRDALAARYGVPVVAGDPEDELAMTDDAALLIA